MRCPICEGDGQFYDADTDEWYPCSSCHGTGSIPSEDEGELTTTIDEGDEPW